jgi:RNA polymerase sigma factor (sigma-70 family)
MNMTDVPSSNESSGDLTARTRWSDEELLQKFVRARDDRAFDALVRRHGPMVLGVCRRILHNVQDAEDAFQATFLLLVRKAPALTRPELLGNWLYGVASRTAMKGRRQTIRRTQRERKAATVVTADSSLEAEAVCEMQRVLDEELERLPTKYRAPLVLCYLRGMTNHEAARHLGWPSGSISHRLARGRRLLRKRLSERRTAIAVLAFGLLLTRKTIRVTVPGQLVKATVQAAVEPSLSQNLALGSSMSAEDFCWEELALEKKFRGSSQVSLVKTGRRSVSLGRRKVSSLVLLAVVLAALASGAFVFAHATSGPALKPSQKKATSGAANQVLEPARSRQAAAIKGQSRAAAIAAQSASPCH